MGPFDLGIFEGVSATDLSKEDIDSFDSSREVRNGGSAVLRVLDKQIRSSCFTVRLSDLGKRNKSDVADGEGFLVSVFSLVWEGATRRGGRMVTLLALPLNGVEELETLELVDGMQEAAILRMRAARS